MNPLTNPFEMIYRKFKKQFQLSHNNQSKQSTLFVFVSINFNRDVFKSVSDVELTNNYETKCINE